MSNLPIRSVKELQRVMAQFPQYVPPTEHYFADGMYCRVVHQPAGVLVVGKLHKRDHFYMILQGALAIVQDGMERQFYEAPTIIVSAAGTKRALLALTDSVYLTVHRTDKTDIAAVEEELIEADPEALFDAYNQLKELHT